MIAPVLVARWSNLFTTRQTENGFEILIDVLANNVPYPRGFSGSVDVVHCVAYAGLNDRRSVKMERSNGVNHDACGFDNPLNIFFIGYIEDNQSNIRGQFKFFGQRLELGW